MAKRKDRRHPIPKELQIVWIAAHEVFMVEKWLTGWSIRQITVALGANFITDKKVHSKAVRTHLYRLFKCYAGRQPKFDNIHNRCGLPLCKNEIEAIGWMVSANVSTAYAAKMLGRSVAEMQSMLDNRQGKNKKTLFDIGKVGK